MKKIIVLGATGFIGKNIAINFSKNKSYEVHAVRYKRPAFKTHNKIKWHKADLRDPNKVNKLLKGMDIVIQAAATTSDLKILCQNPMCM